MISKKIIREFKRLFNFLQWFEVLPYLFSPFNSERDKLVIVTGADSSYYKNLCRFLSSLFLNEPYIKTIVFDLGLIKSERQYLKDTFPTAEIRLFNYSQYPDYFNIKKNAGEYAWKPVILHEVFNEFKCCCCWFDAGILITKPLSTLRKIVKKIGMYSPISSGVISDWTHPKTLAFLNVSSNLFYKRNLSGGIVAVCYQNAKARDLVNKWKDCALIRECIAPIGSSKKNHRQDQAVLSVISHQSGITKNMPTLFYGFKVHQNID